MSKSRKTHYHSTVSRRDFMKILGMGAFATAGGTLMNGPFKDLDEMMASPVADRKMPFWVKEVDEPTVKIDWDTMEVFPHLGNSLFNPNAWGGEAGVKEWMDIQQGNIDAVTESVRNNVPGQSLKDHALADAQCWGWGPTAVAPSWTGPDTEPNPMWEHPTMLWGPEHFGVPKYEGTPEENSRMVRVAGRILGAADMGFVKLDERTKKLLYGNIVFEDVEKGYDDPERHVSVLPNNKDLWVICAVIPQSLNEYGYRRSWANSNTAAYSRAAIYSNRIKTFLSGLGYQHYGGGTGSVGRAVGFGVMAGLAEYGRPGIMVSPQYGTNFRTVMLTVTDLPLAVTKPIDAGISNFCRTCQKCAEMCPSGAISTNKETQWADWADGEQPWQAKGLKGWYIDAKKCYGYMLGNEPDCNMCQTVCPFSKFDSAVMHDLVKMSISSTPVLNNTIRKLDDTFGYGKERGTDMWDVDPMDIPLWGLDTSRS